VLARAIAGALGRRGTTEMRALIAES
jgi:hypothetical protein